MLIVYRPHTADDWEARGNREERGVDAGEEAEAGSAEAVVADSMEVGRVT